MEIGKDGKLIGGIFSQRTWYCDVLPLFLSILAVSSCLLRTSQVKQQDPERARAEAVEVDRSDDEPDLSKTSDWNDKSDDDLEESREKMPQKKIRKFNAKEEQKEKIEFKSKKCDRENETNEKK